MKKNRQKRLRTLELILLIFIPAIFLIIGVIIIELRAPKIESQQTTLSLPNTYKINGLNPSDVLADISYYDGKEINLNGIVSYGEKSCTNRVCQQDDPCCGCDTQRDLIIKDAKPNLMQQSEIRLYNPSKASICQKNHNSCEYSCEDWTIGGTYNIDANFVVVRPMGLTLSRGYLEYYLEVRNKKNIPIPTPSLNNKNILDNILGIILKPLLPSPEP